MGVHRLLLLVLLLGPGCSSFGTSDGSDAADAGTPPAANAGSADAAAADAVAPDGGPVDAGCIAPRCEDFETDSWKASWAPSGSGVAVTDGESSSGNHAIDLALSTNDTPRFSRSLGVARHVVVSISIRVLTPGDGELDFFNITDAAAAGAKGVHVTHRNMEKDFVLEIPTKDNGRDIKVLAKTFAAYTRVTIDLDVAQHTYSCTVGDEPFSGELDPAWMPSALYVQAGAAYATNIVPWHIRFDDADILTVP